MSQNESNSELRDIEVLKYILVAILVVLCIGIVINWVAKSCDEHSLQNNGIQAAGVVLDNDFTPSDKYLIEYTYDNKKGRMVAKSAIEDSKIQVGDSAMIIFDSEDDTNNKVLYFFETKIDTVSESRIIVSRKPIDELRHPLGPVN